VGGVTIPIRADRTEGCSYKILSMATEFCLEQNTYQFLNKDGSGSKRNESFKLCVVQAMLRQKTSILEEESSPRKKNGGNKQKWGG